MSFDEIFDLTAGVFFYCILLTAIYTWYDTTAETHVSTDTNARYPRRNLSYFFMSSFVGRFEQLIIIRFVAVVRLLALRAMFDTEHIRRIHPRTSNHRLPPPLPSVFLLMSFDQICDFTAGGLERLQIFIIYFVDGQPDKEKVPPWQNNRFVFRLLLRKRNEYMIAF